jgi:hypothetical protein
VWSPLLGAFESISVHLFVSVNSLGLRASATRIVGHALLVFVRCLASPIIPLATLPVIVRNYVVENANQADRNRATRALLDSLPVLNHQILARLLRLLVTLQELPTITAFSQQQLVACWAHLVCWEGAKTTDMNAEQMALARKVFLMLLLEYSNMHLA